MSSHTHPRGDGPSAWLDRRAERINTASETHPADAPDAEQQEGAGQWR